MVSSKTVPEYAVFDDYRYFVRVAVLVRWFLLVVWFFLQNYRADFGDVTYYTNTVLASFLAIVNAYVGWRIWKAKPHYALACPGAERARPSVHHHGHLHRRRF